MGNRYRYVNWNSDFYQLFQPGLRIRTWTDPYRYSFVLLDPDCIPKTDTDPGVQISLYFLENVKRNTWETFFF